MQRFSGKTNYQDWKERVYLATYPRSGNHWMRYLFEEATNIATSCVVHDIDPPHETKIYPWGGYCCTGGYNGNCRYAVKGEPVLIKTHFPPQDSYSAFINLPCRAIIRIVRHPVDSFHSRWIYQTRHDPKGNIIPLFKLKEYISEWKTFQNYWNKQKNVFTIRYEDMLENPKHYLKQALDISGFSYSEQDLQRAVEKNPPQGKPFKHLEYYSKQSLDLIYSELGDLMEHYAYKKKYNEE